MEEVQLVFNRSENVSQHIVKSLYDLCLTVGFVHLQAFHHWCGHTITALHVTRPSPRALPLVGQSHKSMYCLLAWATTQLNQSIPMMRVVHYWAHIVFRSWQQRQLLLDNDVLNLVFGVAVRSHYWMASFCLWDF